MKSININVLYNFDRNKLFFFGLSNQTIKMENNILALILEFIISISGYSQNLEQEFDLLLSKDYPTSDTGAAALVAVNGNVIYKKAFGKANLELGVNMTPNNIFEIG